MGILSKIEDGTISPSLATLGALVKALNISISSLFAEMNERRDFSYVKSGQGVRIALIWIKVLCAWSA